MTGDGDTGGSGSILRTTGGYAFITRKDGKAVAVYVGTASGADRAPTTLEALVMELATDLENTWKGDGGGAGEEEVMERVAKAMYFISHSFGWENESDTLRWEYLEMARAALQAIAAGSGGVPGESQV